jgi:ABC-type dipeptide/oligopeptide/nickel transport system permease subunit
VDAARALGGSSLRIICAHIVPNVVPTVIVQASFTMAAAIGTIAGLGFLGLGAQPPTAELGAMLSEGRKYLLQGNWWYSGFPGAAIMAMVLCLNLVGDMLHARLDPRLRRARRDTSA